MTTASTSRLDRFHPGAIWPDTNGVHINAHGGGIVRHDDRYYWFGEHKIAGSLGNSAQVGVHCYSSADLYNWDDEGIALRVSEDPASDIVRGCVLERPKVLRSAATGKFVMWFHLEPPGADYMGARTGIAISDKVTGPYQFVRAIRPNAGHWPTNVPADWKRPLTDRQLADIAALNMRGGPVPNYPTDVIFRRDFAGGQMARDMNLFMDDDGSAYHVHASEDNGVLHLSRLTDDLLDTTGQYVRLFPGRFHEAPAIFKRNGRYYLFSSDCTGWLPNPARSAVADSIWGPWTELGNPCVGTPAEVAVTFDAQSTFVLPVAGRDDAFVFMADRWRPQDAIDGRYVWLPVRFDAGGRPTIAWADAWDLGAFAPRLAP